MNVKKICDLLSITVLVSCPVALGVVYTQTRTSPAVAQSPEVITNQNFPLIQPKLVTFKKDGLEKLTERQKLDQLRDWLLITVLSNKGLSSEQISQSIYDLPTVRYDFMSPITNFEYGTTRSRYIGNGKVVAIVPKTASKEERINDLAHIADRQTKDQGQKPKVIEVFEYEIDPTDQSATITRRDAINSEEIFSSAYGYYETTINSKDDLQNLLNQVDDITFAQVDNYSLKLGGRKIFGIKHQGIRLEDIAALWQSEKKIEERPQDFNYVNGSGFSLDPSFDYNGLQKTLDNSKPLLQSIKLQGKPVINEQDIQQVKQGLKQKDIVPYRQLVGKLGKFLDSKQGSKAIEEGEIGKQIDQEVKLYEKRLLQEADTQLKAYDKQLQQEIKAEANAAQKLGKSPADIQLEITAKAQQKEQKFKENLIQQKIAEEKRYYQDKINKKNAEIKNLLYTDITKGFIFARYDGDLQGTEVGMILFYTDLLAKLWGFDYANSAPEKSILDFKAEKNIAVSSIYKEELKRVSGTRVWFEPNKKEIQVADAGNGLIFSRIATKVSARSHNPLKGKGQKNEEAPNAVSDAFVNFWNAHYEEVAEFEPYYKKLNSIMKWSMLISWINHSGNNSYLDFLTDVKVKRDWNFSEWVQANRNKLRFQGWDTQPCNNQSEITIEKPICFYKPGYKGTKAEAMPVLNSKSFKWFGEQYFLSGGVSLSSKDLFSEIRPINKTTLTSDVVLRPNMDSFTKDGDLFTIQAKSIAKDLGKNGTKGTTYTFKTITKSEILTTIIPEESLNFRSQNANLTYQQITSKTIQTLAGITIKNDIGGTEFGNLNVTKTANGFSVAFESRAVDAGYSLASHLSKTKGSIPDALKKIDNVEFVRYSSSQPNDYYVKLQESEQWVKVSEGGGVIPPSKPPKTRMAVGEPEDGARNLKIEWLDETQIPESARLVYENPELRGKGANDKSLFNPHEEAKKFAADPDKYRELNKLDLNSQTQNIDNSLKAKNYNQAAKLIDDSVKIYGSEPNLMLRRVVALAGQKGLNIEPVPRQGTNVSFDKKNVFDEINRVVANNKFQRIETDKAFYYVQDHPGLNNRDWNASVQPGVPFSGARFYKLQSGKIGGVKISLSGINDVKTSSHAATKAQVSNPSYRLYMLPLIPQTEDKCENLDELETNKTANCPTEKPAYIVTVSDNE
ncbi:hypothetical protein BV378_15345 [Nostoc sp. RF31YmG]|nr:hypothetical protein BV378_15345 [Nostoc sp. RF31YmG]